MVFYKVFSASNFVVKNGTNNFYHNWNGNVKYFSTFDRAKKYFETLKMETRQNCLNIFGYIPECPKTEFGVFNDNDLHIDYEEKYMRYGIGSPADINAEYCQIEELEIEEIDERRW